MYNFLDAIIFIKYVCVYMCVCVCVCVCVYTGQVVQSVSNKHVLPLMYFELLVIQMLVGFQQLINIIKNC